MRLSWTFAAPDDAEEVAALRNLTANDLTARFGKGPWSGQCTPRGVRADHRFGHILLGRHDGALLATLHLSTKKPWAIDRAYFTPVQRPLYLTSMAVAPQVQRQGLGRQSLGRATEVAREFPAQSILLDAFDHPLAGAGEFYRKCGFREVGRVVYREVPLRYYEQLL